MAESQAVASNKSSAHQHLSRLAHPACLHCLPDSIPSAPWLCPGSSDSADPWQIHGAQHPFPETPAPRADGDAQKEKEAQHLGEVEETKHRPREKRKDVWLVQGGRGCGRQWKLDRQDGEAHSGQAGTKRRRGSRVGAGVGRRLNTAKRKRGPKSQGAGE